jgi:hypothetical protein
MMKRKRRRTFVSILVALTVALAPFARMGEDCASAEVSANSGAEGNATPGFIKNAIASTVSLPTPQWPFPCAPSGSCHPHWFYLVNGTTVTADSPLVLTVTGSFPYGQPTAENGVTEPAVTVGISGSGLTLQPRNTTTYADNQMWYAVEASNGNINPSYLISSLPPLINPVFITGTGSSPSTNLALGYIGSPTLASASATISSVSLGSATGSHNGYDVDSYYATVETTGPNNFQIGQIVELSGVNTGTYNGIWTIQSVDTSNNSFTFTIPYQDRGVSSGSGGTAMAMSGVYLLQQNSQHLDPAYNNSFQQWTFDGSDRTVCNQQQVCLYSANTAPKAGSPVSAGPKPSPVTSNYQWYFYPDRTLSQILQQSPVAFPTLSTTQQTEAQNYITNKLGLSPTSCTYNNNTYVGLRCEYSNLAAPLSTYVTLLSIMTPPSSSTITPANWQKVKRELLLELTDAIAVQNLFNQVGWVYDTVFLESEDLLNQDLADLAMDLTDETASKKTFSWQTLVEGLLYTALNVAGAFFGDPKAGSQTEKLFKGIGVACGASANLMETGWNTAMAEGSGSSTNPLANEFEAAAADLYQYLFNDFTILDQIITSEEEQILQDWGELQLVGLLAQETPSLQNGMAGLAWNPSASSALVEKFTNAYQLALMEQLLPQFFNLYIAIDWVGGGYDGGGLSNQQANTFNSGTSAYLGSVSNNGVPSPLPTPDSQQSPVPPMLLDQYSTPIDVQGSQYGMWVVGWLYTSDAPGNGSTLSNSYLTPELAQDVVNANPYLLYNGLGAWSTLSSSNPSILADLGCTGSFTTLTNFTSRALMVVLHSSNSNLFGGGYGTTYAHDSSGNSSVNDYSSVETAGVSGPVYRTLPPYGVLQFGAQGSSQTLDISIWDFSSSRSQSIASFDVNLSGSGKNSCGTTSISNTGAIDGYTLTTSYESGTIITNQETGRTPLLGIAN